MQRNYRFVFTEENVTYDYCYINLVTIGFSVVKSINFISKF